MRFFLVDLNVDPLPRLERVNQLGLNLADGRTLQ